jgi:UPF0755 protein
MFQKSFASKLKILSFLLLLALLVLGGWTILEWRRPCRNYSEKEKFIDIPRGTASYRVARILQQEGVIRHWIWFVAYVKLAGRHRSLQAGEYQFNEPLTIAQVADKLFHGRIFYHEITIPEGFSLFEIGDLLAQHKLISPPDFWTFSRRVEWIKDLVPQARSLEGFLFPDTYRFTRRTTPEQIIRTMVERFRKVFQGQLRETFQVSPLSLTQVVTLASLIEKETAVANERNLVSAVLQNRLRIGMPLQCDPTVIYAAKLNGTYQGEISHTALAVPSSYNTYQRTGLPPGPIANPGLESLQAALSPAKVDYLYFVSNNQGGHVFSRTLEEHNRAVAAYRRGSRQLETSKRGQL